MCATFRPGNVDAVVALLEFGANPNYESATGETAFSVATKIGNREVRRPIKRPLCALALPSGISFIHPGAPRSRRRGI